MLSEHVGLHRSMMSLFGDSDAYLVKQVHTKQSVSEQFDKGQVCLTCAVFQSLIFPPN